MRASDESDRPVTAIELERVHELHRLLDVIELVDVSLQRVSGEVHEDEQPAAEPDVTFQVFKREEDAHLVIRCVIEVTTHEARFVADVSCRYAYQSRVAVDPPVLDEFMSDVGVLTAFPFVREAVHQTAARMRVAAPVLGLLKAGQIDLVSDDHLADPRAIPTSRVG